MMGIDLCLPTVPVSILAIFQAFDIQRARPISFQIRIASPGLVDGRGEMAWRHRGETGRIQPR